MLDITPINLILQLKASNLPLASAYAQTIQEFVIFKWIPDIPVSHWLTVLLSLSFRSSLFPESLLCWIFLPFHGEDRRCMTQTISASATHYSSLQPNSPGAPPMSVWLLFGFIHLSHSHSFSTMIFCLFVSLEYKFLSSSHFWLPETLGLHEQCFCIALGLAVTSCLQKCL